MIPENGIFVWSGFLGVKPHLNPGLVFEFSVPEFLFFTLLNVVLLAVAYGLVVSVRERRTGATLALLLILAGGASNFFDRVAYGAVIDFLVVGFTSVFNVADVMIVCGFLILWYVHSPQRKFHLPQL